MQRLAHEPGGAFFEVSDAGPIAQIYAQIEETLCNQYAFSYTPQTAGATWALRNCFSACGLRLLRRHRKTPMHVTRARSHTSSTLCCSPFDYWIHLEIQSGSRMHTPALY